MDIEQTKRRKWTAFFKLWKASDDKDRQAIIRGYRAGVGIRKKLEARRIG